MRIDVGRDEDTKAFMSRTWLLTTKPLPWSDVRYVGFTGYGSLVEMKFIEPSNIIHRLHQILTELDMSRFAPQA